MAWFGCITLFPTELAVSLAKFVEMNNVQNVAHYLSYHMCVCWNLRYIKYITLTMTYPNANFNPSRYFISFAWYKQQRLKNFKVKMQNRANLRVVWLRQNGWIFRKFPNFQCTTSLGVLHQQYYFHGRDKNIRLLFELVKIDWGVGCQNDYIIT